MWEAAGREGSLMLALAETIPAGPISCNSWLDNLFARLLSRVLLRQLPGVVEDRNGPFCLALLVRH